MMQTIPDFRGGDENMNVATTTAERTMPMDFRPLPLHNKPENMGHPGLHIPSDDDDLLSDDDSLINSPDENTPRALGHDHSPRTEECPSSAELSDSPDKCLSPGKEMTTEITKYIHCYL